MGCKNVQMRAKHPLAGLSEVAQALRHLQLAGVLWNLHAHGRHMIVMVLRVGGPAENLAQVEKVDRILWHLVFYPQRTMGV